ncbi:PREDICTED: prostaglandin E synthase 2 isoform X2 [Ceratosolen solmsi marchali]|uniref:Prostaglandin E synthase 2 isoform X2 n=1 Tax=Ceratosolen solmsi marchali TaxID=326594 RepID=A0AAJ7DZV3_9HYME|nr:PREDICTED: prostaglandin E synthase 2 isoform X2 [Ceratosolen solmsi marchali]
MAAFHRLHIILRKTKCFNEFIRFNRSILNSLTIRSLCTYIEQPKSKNNFKFSLIGTAVGFALGIGYALKEIASAKQKLALEGTIVGTKLLKHKPDVKLSRTVFSHIDNTGLQLTLFQYQSCPFCCKVRVLLDYYGLSYDVVEVDPVFRQEISWSNYRKVPILLVKIDREYQILTDSSMIVSLLTSYLNSKSVKINELAKFYPTMVMYNEKGQFKHEIVNKYFLMYPNSVFQDKDLNHINEEYKWRKWTDNVFIHTLSPNVYRTLKEAYQTFNWFSKVGHWDEYFPFWEQAIMVHVGAFAMWLISKRLKKRHNLKDNVRESFYDEINIWLYEIKIKGGIFMGGLNPDLCDLTVYGVLNSIEGCQAFKDALINTNLGTWYNAVKEKVDSHSDAMILDE